MTELAGSTSVHGPRNPRDLPPKQDPRRPRASNPLWESIQAAVDQFGVTRARTKSRRHGHQPKAREHAEDYFANKVLGESVRSIARSRGRAPSTIAASIRRGRELVRSGSDSEGFMDPSGRRLERDPDSDRGYWESEG